MNEQTGKEGDETKDDTGCGFGDCRPVMGVAKGWRRHGWGSRGDCRLPGGLEELHAAPLRDGGAAAETAFPPLPRRGRKVRVGVGVGGITSSVFPYPSLSHSLFVALFGISSLLQLRGHNLYEKEKENLTDET